MFQILSLFTPKTLKYELIEITYETMFVPWPIIILERGEKNSVRYVLISNFKHK